MGEVSHCGYFGEKMKTFWPIPKILRRQAGRFWSFLPTGGGSRARSQSDALNKPVSHPPPPGWCQTPTKKKNGMVGSHVHGIFGRNPNLGPRLSIGRRYKTLLPQSYRRTSNVPLHLDSVAPPPCCCPWQKTLQCKTIGVAWHLEAFRPFRLQRGMPLLPMTLPTKWQVHQTPKHKHKQPRLLTVGVGGHRNSEPIPMLLPHPTANVS